MAEVRITGIRKDRGNHFNPHEAISAYQWISFTGETNISYRSEMVKYLEGGDNAYVQDKFGNRAYCKVRVSTLGNKFLQTIADGKYTDNLLDLDEC